MNHIHESAFQLIYDDHAHSFQDKLEMRKKKTIHQKKPRIPGKGNLQISAWVISTHNERYFQSKR